MRIRLLTALACLTCLFVFGVGQADAVEYVDHVRVESGANYFGPYVTLHVANTYPFGEAIGCAGIRGYGLSCPLNSHEIAGYELTNDVKSEAYIHDHATYTSYFSGYYF